MRSRVGGSPSKLKVNWHHLTPPNPLSISPPAFPCPLPMCLLTNHVPCSPTSPLTPQCPPLPHAPSLSPMPPASSCSLPLPIPLTLPHAPSLSPYPSRFLMLPSSPHTLRASSCSLPTMCILHFCPNKSMPENKVTYVLCNGMKKTTV